MPKGKVIGSDQGKRPMFDDQASPFGAEPKPSPFTTSKPTPPKANVTDPNNPPPKRRK